jgi:predicted RNase H-like HicB family nuclease
LFEKDGQIVGLCLELNVSSFGDTPDEARAALQEAVTLYLEECRRMGTLEMVLEEAGYRHAPTAPDHWLLRQPIEVRQVEIAVA